jgi:hypothetical protein
MRPGRISGSGRRAGLAAAPGYLCLLRVGAHAPRAGSAAASPFSEPGISAAVEDVLGGEGYRRHHRCGCCRRAKRRHRPFGNWVIVTAAAYLAIGIGAFRLGERITKIRGTLGAY